MSKLYMFNNIGYADNNTIWELPINDSRTREDLKILFRKKVSADDIEEFGGYGRKSITLAKAFHHLKLDIVEVTNA